MDNLASVPIPRASSPLALSHPLSYAYPTYLRGCPRRYHNDDVAETILQQPFAGLTILPTPTSPPDEATTEETLLAMLLAAHSDLQEALTLHSSALRAHTDSLAILATTQLSLGETKFDRTTAGEMDRDGNYQSPPPPPLTNTSFGDLEGGEEIARAHTGKGKEVVASGSGSTPATTNGKTLNPYAAYLTPPTPTTGKFAEEEEEELRVRSEPSEKAFGKLRSVSTRTEVDEGEQQTRLEAQLREKYSRNYEEEQGRRSAELERRSPSSSIASAADRKA